MGNVEEERRQMMAELYRVEIRVIASKGESSYRSYKDPQKERRIETAASIPNGLPGTIAELTKVAVDDALYELVEEEQELNKESEEE